MHRPVLDLGRAALIDRDEYSLSTEWLAIFNGRNRVSVSTLVSEEAGETGAGHTQVTGLYEIAMSGYLEKGFVVRFMHS